jgi:hypothetical protein
VKQFFKVVLDMSHNRGTPFAALRHEQMEIGESKHVDNKVLGAWHLIVCMLVLYSKGLWVRYYILDSV